MAGHCPALKVPPGRNPPVTTAVTRRRYGDRMGQGIAGILGARPRQPRIVRTLWRMQGPSRIIAARIERHPFGRELVIFFEGYAEDVIEARFEWAKESVLEQHADQLRELLATKGWSEIRT